MKFDKILSKIEYSTDLVFKIKDIQKLPRAIAKFASLKYPESEYIKIVFLDQSYLLLNLQAKDLYYSDFYEINTQIPDKLLGSKKILFKGKKYLLENEDDYQFVKRLYLGSPLDIEGEVRFYDYIPEEGEKEFLSLGWITRTNKRSDLNPVKISSKKIWLL